MGGGPRPPSVPPPPPPPGGGFPQQPQQGGYYPGQNGQGFPPNQPYGQAPPPPPPPQPQYGGGQPAQAAATGQLSVIYNGQRFPVNKDRFIIGRGKQSSDMTIKDPNVSRQHAMVEFLNGQYYMVDMGSTNGVEYNGQRIARKAIAEGDLFRICDHEVRFSYR
jgi:pSer/pThr/pTyr-binding forkhead associated (FHA) protein